MRNPDRIGAAVMLVAAAAFWLQMGSVDALGGSFPRLVLWPLTLLSVVLLVKSWIRPEPPAAFFEAQPGPMLVLAVTVILWIALLEVLGFAVSTTLAYGFLTWYLGGRPRDVRKVAVSLAIIVGEVALVYWVFNDLLLVRLPQGLLI
ncbi:tripartite tricarboxylate transporter TctB family protein [Limnochorda pilosa]|uniref:DUF1468 domain-containing protein n=1 Tax=Limnochorda pilosa TaxID=1555112 RepID=A0A0K2SJI1_LIMPI|nr:tripartite tricarboxylate transporter TctB family protein [Limnochorda pilosa]BAS27162.1 hypothetical protein LIP_1307 [Limnochorda pilosa]